MPVLCCIEIVPVRMRPEQEISNFFDGFVTFEQDLWKIVPTDLKNVPLLLMIKSHLTLCSLLPHFQLDFLKLVSKVPNLSLQFLNFYKAIILDHI